MPLKSFAIPENVDTRLIQHREMLYKFKIQYKSTNMRNIKLPCSRNELNNEIQRAIQALLCTKGEQFPIKTKHFLINCGKLPWKAGRKLKFKKGGKIVKHNPYVHVLTVISKMEYEEPLSDHNNSNNNENTIRQSEVSDKGTVPQTESSSRPVRRLITKSPERSERYFTRSQRTRVIDTSLSKRKKKLHHRQLAQTVSSDGTNDIYDNRATGVDIVAHREVEHNPPDRHIIEQEEIQENMKLQQLASPTAGDTSPRKDRKTHRRSLIGSILDTIIRPVQKVFESTG